MTRYSYDLFQTKGKEKKKNERMTSWVTSEIRGQGKDSIYFRAVQKKSSAKMGLINNESFRIAFMKFAIDGI